MKIRSFLLLFSLVFAASLHAQPSLVYKTFAEASAAGKAALEKTGRQAADLKVAEDAYEQAIALAKTDAQKADALIALGGVLERSSRVSGVGTGSRTNYTIRYDEAFARYESVLDLADITDDKRADAMLLIGDFYAKSYKNKDFAARFTTTAKKSMKELAREEFTKILALPKVSADNKVKALTERARTYDLTIAFGIPDPKQFEAALKDYRSAFDTPGGSDDLKAIAWLDVAKIAEKAGNAEMYVEANGQIISLPNVSADKKVAAYERLTSLLVQNGKLAEARKFFVDALKTPSASAEDLASIYRVAALAHLIELAQKNTTASTEVEKFRSAARAELTRSTSFPKLGEDKKVKILMDNGKYFQAIKNDLVTFLALEEYEKAIKAPSTSDKDRAAAQYEIGETYFLLSKFAEAKAAYEKVPAANAQYHGYAQTRIKTINEKQSRP